MKPPSFLASAIAGASLVAILISGAQGTPTAAATPPPTPPPIGGAPVTPQPEPSDFPAGAMPAGAPSSGPAASATPSPPPATHKGLDGVWEVAIQRPNTNIAEYTHFALAQQGDALSGTYLDAHGKKFPLAGSIDSGNVRLIVSLPNGTTLLLEGKLDGTTDMIGILTSADGEIPFTAAYRPKEKWIDNVNASPGGVGGQGGGGYTPP